MLRRPLSKITFSTTFFGFLLQHGLFNHPRPIVLGTKKTLAPLRSTPNADAKSDGAQTDEPLPTFSDSSSFSKPDARSLAPNQLDLVKQRLRSWTERAAITLRVKADDFTASTKDNFFRS